MNGCRILILVENGAGKGLGHLRRMLVLAQALAQLDCAVVLGLTDPTNAGPFDATPYAIIAWRSDDAAIVEGFDAVVLDGYDYDRSLPARWRNRIVRAAIDDTGERPQELEIVVNHNLYGAQCDYSGYAVDRVLGGPEFALVLPAFRTLRSAPPSPDRGILVSFGGTDDGRYAVPFVRALRAGGVCATVHVAFQTAAPDAAGALGAVVHVGRPLEEVIGQVRVYVGAAGVTVLESLAAGVPIVVCSIAANHHMNIVAIRRLGMPAFDMFDPDAMAAAVARILDGMRASVPSLVDGLGAQRVAQHIVDTVERRRHGARERRPA
jgi:spore coat polysaccharide biosynthesis predicted glycosyltransferase SpsG